MLRVKVELRPSAIHGLGVFTVGALAAGTVVAGWDATEDFVLTAAEYRALPPGLVRLLAPYVWTDAAGRVYGTADEGRFTNHSETPNLRHEAQSGLMVAARDIAAGEELTENYEEYDAAFRTYAREVNG